MLRQPLGITSFSGQTIDSTTFLVKYTYSGDANLDGAVNGLDFNALAMNFGNSIGKNWIKADFNYDGRTNTLDFNMLWRATLTSAGRAALGRRRSRTGGRAGDAAFFSVLAFPPSQASVGYPGP